MRANNRPSGPRKRGFMKALEGIMAALLLLGYTSSFFVLKAPEVNWNSILTQQQMQEYASALGRTPVQDLILRNKKAEFLEMTQHILGPGKGYALSTKNVVDDFVEIAVILDPTADTQTAGSARLGDESDCAGWEGACYVMTFDGVELLVADPVVDGKQEYIALYKRHSREDPFYVTDFISLQTNMWQIGSMRYAAAPTPRVDVAFYRTEKVREIRNAMEAEYRFSPLSLNGRAVTVVALGALPADRTIRDADLLVISENVAINEDNYLIFDSLAKSGTNILAFVTPETTITPEFQALTNSKIVTYDINGEQTKNAVLANTTFRNTFFELPRYMHALGFDIHTPTEGSDGSQVGAVSLGEERRYMVSITDEESSQFDRFAIDYGPYLPEGATFEKDGNSYRVGYIQPDGVFVTLQPFRNHTFIGYFFPEKLVSRNNLESEFLLYDAQARYTAPGEAKTEFRNIGDSYVDPDKNFAGAAYEISLNPPTMTYDGVVYANNSRIQIGPDLFDASIEDVARVNWTLRSRWRVPYGISNHNNQGTVVLLPKPDSDDEWAYVRAAAFQMLKGEKEIISGGRGKRGSVSVTDTFIASRDFYQPYEVTMQAWY